MLALTPLISTLAVAEERRPVDVVVVLDSSGSMKQNDPDRLRVPAAKLLFSLLQAQDRVAVVSFSDTGYPVLRLTSLEAQANLEQALAAVDRVSSSGAYTNLHDAITVAADLLPTQAGVDANPAIILMSDGVMDVADKSQQARLLEQLQSKVLARLRDSGIAIHAIAFTEASDQQLLRGLAEGSKGQYHLARSDRDLHGIFAALFEYLAMPDMLPIREDSFQVDSHVQELNVLAAKRSEDQPDIELIAPDGEALTREQGGWFDSPMFTLITVSDPMPGQWQLRYSESAVSASYIHTDLGLRVEMSSAHHVGRPIRVRARLASDTDAPADVLIEQLEMQLRLLRDVPGQGEVLQTTIMRRATGSAWFEAELVVAEPGQYRLAVQAQTPALQRLRRHPLDVTQAPSDEVPAAPEQVDDPNERTSKDASADEAMPAVAEQEDGKRLWPMLIFALANLLVLLGAVWLWRKRRDQPSLD